MQKINIFLDGLFYKCSGIGRYYESLLNGLVESGIHTYTAISTRREKDFLSEFKQKDNLTYNFVNFNPFSFSELIRQGNFLKQLEQHSQIIFHYPNINLPIRIPRNLVVTIHDICPCTEFWDRGYLKKKAFIWYLNRAVKAAKKIITVSENSKKQIVDFCPNAESKIKVIHNCINNKFLNKTKGFSQRRIIKGEYILFVGNRRKHKNISRLILAFNSVKMAIPNLKLVIAGNKYSDKDDDIDLLLKQLYLNDSIVQILSPNDTEIINLYKYAHILVLPSLYEGFGYPPLESMALETPVIASNIPGLKEVCSDAAYYINPQDTEDLARGIFNLTTNSELRKMLTDKGRQRIQLFDQKRFIEEHKNIYEEIYNHQ